MIIVTILYLGKKYLMRKKVKYAKMIAPERKRGDSMKLMRSGMPDLINSKSDKENFVNLDQMNKGKGMLKGKKKKEIGR